MGQRRVFTICTVMGTGNANDLKEVGCPGEDLVKQISSPQCHLC